MVWTVCHSVDHLLICRRLGCQPPPIGRCSDGGASSPTLLRPRIISPLETSLCKQYTIDSRNTPNRPAEGGFYFLMVSVVPEIMILPSWLEKFPACFAACSMAVLFSSYNTFHCAPLPRNRSAIAHSVSPAFMVYVF